MSPETQKCMHVSTGTDKECGGSPVVAQVAVTAGNYHFTIPLCEKCRSLYPDAKPVLSEARLRDILMFKKGGVQ